MPIEECGYCGRRLLRCEDCDALYCEGCDNRCPLCYETVDSDDIVDSW